MSRGIFTNVHKLPIEVKNCIEINGQTLLLMLIPSEGVLRLIINNGDLLNEDYDIHNPNEVQAAFADFSAYATAAINSNQLRAEESA